MPGSPPSSPRQRSSSSDGGSRQVKLRGRHHGRLLADLLIFGVKCTTRLALGLANVLAAPSIRFVGRDALQIAQQHSPFFCGICSPACPHVISAAPTSKGLWAAYLQPLEQQDRPDTTPHHPLRRRTAARAGGAAAFVHCAGELKGCGLLCWPAVPADWRKLEDASAWLCSGGRAGAACLGGAPPLLDLQVQGRLPGGMRQLLHRKPATSTDPLSPAHLHRPRTPRPSPTRACWRQCRVAARCRCRLPWA